MKDGGEMQEMLPSFLDELELIKTSAMKTEKGVPAKELMKRFAKNLAIYAPATGLGIGAGYAFDRFVTPKMKLSPTKRNLLAGAAGILSALSGAIATRKMLAKENEPPSNS